jgi:hypothetical protein
MTAKRMEHQSIPTERYDNLSLIRISIAIHLDKRPICLLSFCCLTCDKGDLLEFSSHDIYQERPCPKKARPVQRERQAPAPNCAPNPDVARRARLFWLIRLGNHEALNAQA